MIRSHLKASLQHLLKNKLYSFINLLSLILGITACFLVVLSISEELGYDKFHKNLDNIYLMNLHPEGSLMAFVTFDAIKVLNLNNNKVEVLFEEKMTFPNFTMDWSPDGKWLYFVRWNRDKKHAELWRITSVGKDLQQIDITFPDLRFLSIHPDGKQLVFTVGRGDENKSFWVMKNFLPNNNNNK